MFPQTFFAEHFPPLPTRYVYSWMKHTGRVFDINLEAENELPSILAIMEEERKVKEALDARSPEQKKADRFAKLKSRTKMLVGSLKSKRSPRRTITGAEES